MLPGLTGLGRVGTAGVLVGPAVEGDFVVGPVVCMVMYVCM